MRDGEFQGHVASAKPEGTWRLVPSWKWGGGRVGERTEGPGRNEEQNPITQDFLRTVAFVLGERGPS